MARWRLRGPHYINVPGTEWEHKETDRDSGRQVRKVFPVPMLLDPADPSVQNYDGECYVSDGEGSLPRDHIFLGEPTPDMEPMDEAAEKINASLQFKWTHPIETLPAQGLSSHEQAFVDMFAKMMNNLPVSTKAVDPDVMAAMVARLDALEARNAELEAAAAPSTARRA